jgi:hypothetical protein
MEALGALREWLVANDAWLEAASHLAVLAGAPLLLAAYMAGLIAQSRRRELGGYDSLEARYVEFQKLALDHPALDVADRPLSNPPELNEAQAAQQRTLYEILFSLFERAYLVYRPGFPLGVLGRLFLSPTRKLQWRAWVNYIDRHLERESCRDAWFNGRPPQSDVGQDFDPRFERFMWRRVRKGRLAG